MDFAIIDFQGFKDESTNRFIVKEFCLLTENIKFLDFMKSPFAFELLNENSQKTAKWLTKNYHGIKWDDGYISVSKLRETISPILKNKIIYVKGEEKIQWLRDIMNDSEKRTLYIVNMEIIGCDLALHNNTKKSVNSKCDAAGYDETDEINQKQEINLKTNNFCFKHRFGPIEYNCALQNVIKLKKWYSEYCKQK